MIKILNEANLRNYLIVAYVIALKKPAIHLVLVGIFGIIFEVNGLGSDFLISLSLSWLSLFNVATIGFLYFASIWVLLFFATMFYIYGPPMKDMKRMVEEYVTPEYNSFFVAEIIGPDSAPPTIIGTIAIVKKPLEKELKVGRLRRMAVDRNFRRQHVAEELVKKCISFCRDKGYDEIELFTTEVHSAAQKLYAKLGFQCEQGNRWNVGKYFFRSFNYRLKLNDRN